MKALIFLSVLTMSFMEGNSQIPKKSETVNLNGVKIYYEVYGSGDPLILLHGFTQSSKSWLPYISDYENEFEVYLVDLRGHGKSSWFTEPLSFPAIAQELNALIQYLKLDHINGIGFSYGGDVLLHLALIRPTLIKSMIIIGSCGTWHAKDFPEFVEYLSYKNIDNLPWMREQQTNEDQIKSILAQMPNYNVTITDAELKSIQVETLVVLGDRDDSTPLDCIVNMKKQLPNSFLWVLPNAFHSAHKDPNKSEFIRVSKDFLSGNWSK